MLIKSKWAKFCSSNEWLYRTRVNP